MTDANVLPLGRLTRSIALCMLVVAAHPASAGTHDSTPVATVEGSHAHTVPDPALTILQTRVDQMQKDLADMKRMLEDRKASQAPPEAWWAIGILGIVFAGAWLVVNWKRENARATEAASGAKMREIIFLQGLLTNTEAQDMPAAIRTRLREIIKS